MSSRSTSPKAEAKGERVQKVLARSGLASRREIDRLIQAGRVVIDGRAAVPGDRLLGDEEVLVDGRHIRLPRVEASNNPEVLIYNKPVGEITSRKDPERRKTVFDSLPRLREGRWIAVGRLDINTSGLILFTTDGELAHRLMHPSYEIDRAYAVRIRGQLSDEQSVRLVQGIPLEDGLAKFTSVTPMESGQTNSWYEVRLQEGRNREVRRMFETIGVTVSRLIRIRFGPIELGRLTRGKHRLLENAERAVLYQAVKLKPPARRR